MCGRFSFDIDYEEVKIRYPNHNITQMKSIFNFAPSMKLPVLTSNNIVDINWGLIPQWAKDKSFRPLINARSETLLEKPSFKNLVDTRRCIILSNGFYEWDSKSKSPYFIQPTESNIIAFGGLFDVNNEGKYSFTIITTKANEKLSKIHHRMPLIIKAGDDQNWLSESKYRDVEHLAKPLANHQVKMKEISNLVNSSKNNNSEIQNKVNRLF